MEGSSQSSLSETPAEFEGVTFRDVPNTFAILQRYWKEINRRYQELPDIEPEPSPLELCPDISLSDEQLEVPFSPFPLFPSPSPSPTPSPKNNYLIFPFLTITQVLNMALSGMSIFFTGWYYFLPLLF